MTAVHPWSLPVPKPKHPHRVRKADGLAPGTKVYRWQGKDYYGAADLAAEIPCDVRTIYKHMRQHGNLDRLKSSKYVNGVLRAGRTRSTHAIVDLDDGRSFEWVSIREMAIALGLTTSTAQRRYHSPSGLGRTRLKQAAAAWAAKQEQAR